MTNSCVPALPKTCPRVAPELSRHAKTCIKRVTKTFPNLFHHFGHFRIIKKKRVTIRQTDRPTDRPTDTPSYIDARTHLKNDPKLALRMVTQTLSSSFLLSYKFSRQKVCYSMHSSWMISWIDHFFLPYRSHSMRILLFQVKNMGRA